jgi:hypothetical protein
LIVVVSKPTAVALKRKGRKPALTKAVSRALVAGGEQIPGNGQFSFGWRAPNAVELVGKNGQAARLSDVESILFVGGTPIDKAEYDRLRALAANIDEAPSQTEIADDRQTHIVDNDASLAIADEVPRGTFRDDFWAQVKQLDDAAIGPQGEPLDEFDQRWQAAGAHHADLQAIAPFTRNNPPSVLHGVLGSQVTVVMSKGPVTAAYWVGDDAETTPVTVTLAPVQKAIDLVNQPSPGLIRAYAKVKFGTRDYSTDVEVDVGSGCQFTISGSMVNVDFALEQIVDINVPDPVFDLAAMLSFKQIMRTAPTTRTRYLDSTTGSGTAKSATFVTVPAAAKNVIFWREAFTVAAVLFFTDYTGTLVYSYSLPANSVMFDPIPLSSDVQYVGVSPNGTISAGRFIFGLSV